MSMDEMRALAQRAVACKGWRWVQGCPIAPYAGEGPERGAFAFVVEHPADGRPMHAFVTPGDGLGVMEIWADDLPDMSHPATLGCLLALVREAWGPLAHASMGVGGWSITDTEQQHPLRGGRATVALGVWDQPTEAHALVAALEAAP